MSIRRKISYYNSLFYGNSTMSKISNNLCTINIVNATSLGAPTLLRERLVTPSLCSQHPTTKFISNILSLFLIWNTKSKEKRFWYSTLSFALSASGKIYGKVECQNHHPTPLSATFAPSLTGYSPWRSEVSVNSSISFLLFYLSTISAHWTLRSLVDVTWHFFNMINFMIWVLFSVS